MQNIGLDLLRSSLLLDGTNSLNDFLLWFKEKRSNSKYSVDPCGLDQMSDWYFDESLGKFKHKTGKFFEISGLRVTCEHPNIPKEWTQPIVNQPEIGLLGLLAKRINGVVHVLVQAKMEPGNVGFIQISPTLQATRSNYTRVHGGRSPRYTEYFIDNIRGSIIFDQLRSEQGTRYYRKRNRNMLVLLEDNAVVDVHEDYFWLTLGQLRKLHEFPNFVHLDCRSILGAMPFFIGSESISDDIKSLATPAISSLTCHDTASMHPMRDLLSWLTHRKVRSTKETEFISLEHVEDWIFDGQSIKHIEGRHFNIVGVTVFSPSREIESWSQPLIKNINGGIIGLLAQVKNGVLHFLVQARFEIGLIDSVEIAPTLQYTPHNHAQLSDNQGSCLVEYFYPDSGHIFLVDTSLSDEGGRFFRSEQRHMVVQIPEDEEIVVTDNFKWMTLGQLHHFGSMELTLNIELRSLLFCLSLV